MKLIFGYHFIIVAWIIDYPQVLERARELKFRCVYFNSGAFAHEDAENVRIVGWLGPADSTIRLDLPATLISLTEPYEQNLAERFLKIWPAKLDGPAWLMPKSHWSFELDHGNRSWMPQVIEETGIDPGLLLSRTNAAAIQFDSSDAPLLQSAVTNLLTNLQSSDFAILFPKHPHLLTIHHHKQLWWQTPDSRFAEFLVKNGY